jgi:hypothetical protein
MTEAAPAAPAAPGASALLTPAAALVIPIASMTPEQATAHLDTIKADPEWRAAFAKGDIKATSEHAELFRVIYDTAKPENQATAREMEQRGKVVDHYRSIANISDDVAKMVMEDQEVSAEERNRVELEWQRLKADPAWTRALLSGDRAARTQKSLIDIVMSRRVKAA